MFTDYSENPILRPSKDGWDCKSASFASVIPAEGWWVMLYSGKSHTVAWKIGAAVSRDGVKWFKHGPPVLEGTKYLWDSWSVHAPVLWRENGNYRVLYTGIDEDAGCHAIGCAESINAHSWNKRLTPALYEKSHSRGIEAWGFLKREKDYIVLYNQLIERPREIYAASTTDFIHWTLAETPLLPRGDDPDKIDYMKYCADIVMHNGWYYITSAMSSYSYDVNAIGLWRVNRLDEDPEFLGEIIQRDRAWKPNEVDTPRIVQMNGDWVRIYYSGRKSGIWCTGLAEGTFE